MSVRFITVIRKPTDDITSYLYSHASVFATGMSQQGFAAMDIVMVEAESETVSFLANYQADRLSSGLYGTQVHDSLPLAIAYAAELGIHVEQV